jgi:hypothetical protein
MRGNRLLFSFWFPYFLFVLPGINIPHTHYDGKGSVYQNHFMLDIKFYAEDLLLSIMNSIIHHPDKLSAQGKQPISF